MMCLDAQKLSCDIGIFVEKLHSKKSSHEEMIFFSLCQKYPKAFENVFKAYKNKERIIDFFRRKYQNEPRESSGNCSDN